MHLPEFISLRRETVDASSYEEALAVLTADERVRMESFRNVRRRECFAVARLAAKRIVAENARCAPEEVRLAIRADGSLDVLQHDLNLSIAHSGDLAVAAVSPTPVGVDIEQVRPRPSSLYRFMLHPDEMALIDSFPLPDDDRIALFWSIKESVLKGQRTGLRHSPKTLRIHPGALPEEVVVRVDNADSWRVSIEQSTDYVIAVSWPE
jgi:4'-phosphopantetheinyl transferase